MTAVFSGVRIYRAPRTAGLTFQEQSAQSRKYLLQALSKYLSRQVLNTEITISSSGKPELSSGLACFNISHSGNIWACAVSNSAIGFDIEVHRELENFDSLCRSCFTENEIAWLKKGDEKKNFFRLWTAKESLMKAYGTGLRLPPQSIELSASGSDFQIVFAGGADDAADWSLCCADFREDVSSFFCAGTKQAIDFSYEELYEE